MRLVFILAMVLAGCVEAAPLNPSVVADLACEGARLAVLYRNKQPAPAPVSEDCENCNGTGKVGDGRIMSTCQVCGGTGKRPKSVLCTSGSCRP